MDRRRMIPNHLIKRLVNSEKCIFEMDPNASNEVLPFFKYSNGLTFDDCVPAEVAAKTRQLFSRLGLTIDPTFKAWYLTLQAAINVQIQAGAALDAGIDPQLWKAANAAGKEVGVLETADALMAFDEAPVEEQVARLNFLLDNPSRAFYALEKLTRAWFAKDLSVFEAELDLNRKLAPETFRGLIDQRHSLWLPQMLPLIEKGDSVVFVVGALHLVGPEGLPALLRERGFEIEPAR
jgi:uncharacterized protein YbaP (TraB family)